MNKEEAFHEWESTQTSPKVTARAPTASAIQSIKQMSKKADDDFMSAMLQSAGDTITIRTLGFSFDQVQSISLKIEDARRLAKWILEHTD